MLHQEVMYVNHATIHAKPVKRNQTIVFLVFKDICIIQHVLVIVQLVFMKTMHNCYAVNVTPNVRNVMDLRLTVFHVKQHFITFKTIATQIVLPNIILKWAQMVM